MGRPFRDVLSLALAALLLAGCASTEEARRLEGQTVFRAGAVAPGMGTAEVVSGPLLRRLGMLMPAFDPAWQVTWWEGDRKKSGAKGGVAGFVTGVAIVQFVPVVVLFWPAAVGVVAGTTALGVIGEQAEDPALARVDVKDREALREAAVGLQPDRLLREVVAESLVHRTGRSPLLLPWHPVLGPDTPGTDPLSDARGQGADGILDLAVEAFGLAVAEEAETFGVFVRIRARILETSGGGLRYERILDHGPGRLVSGLPRPAAYSVEFLALDQARVFRQEVRQAIVGMARVLAEDPLLPLGPP